MELRTRSEQERQHSEEKLQLLVESKNALTDQFRSLASDTTTHGAFSLRRRFLRVPSPRRKTIVPNRDFARRHPD